MNRRRFAQAITATAVVILAGSLTHLAHAHQVDKTKIERAHRQLFADAQSWKPFSRTVDGKLAKKVRKVTKRKWSSKESKLEFEVAFSSTSPGKQSDVLGVMLVRELQTKSGLTAIALGIDLRGRIVDVRGIEGPDAAAIRALGKKLRGKTLKGAPFDLGKGVTARAVARETHAILYVTRELLGAPKKKEKVKTKNDDEKDEKKK